MTKKTRTPSAAAVLRKGVKSSLRHAEAEGSKNLVFGLSVAGGTAAITSPAIGVGIGLRVERWLASSKQIAQLEAEGAARLSEIGAVQQDGATEILARVSMSASTGVAGDLAKAGLKRVRHAGGVLEYRGEGDLEAIRAIVVPHGGRVYQLDPVGHAEPMRAEQSDSEEAEGTDRTEPLAENTAGATLENAGAVDAPVDGTTEAVAPGGLAGVGGAEETLHDAAAQPSPEADLSGPGRESSAHAAECRDAAPSGSNDEAGTRGPSFLPEWLVSAQVNRPESLLGSSAAAAFEPAHLRRLRKAAYARTERTDA
jgi:hypothetical protein